MTKMTDVVMAKAAGLEIPKDIQKPAEEVGAAAPVVDTGAAGWKTNMMRTTTVAATMADGLEIRKDIRKLAAEAGGAPNAAAGWKMNTMRIMIATTILMIMNMNQGVVQEEAEAVHPAGAKSVTGK
jgi:hypothetical protein